MRRALRSFRQACSGTSAMEFALVAPVMLLFMAGIVEMGRAYQIYSAVNRLATRYAISWADCSDVPIGNCGLLAVTGVPLPELGLYTTSAAEQNIAPQLVPVSGIGLRMMQVSLSAAGAPTVVYAYPAGITPSSNELAIAQTAIANGQTGVIVSVSYTYTPIFFANILNNVLGQKTFLYTVAQDKS